MLIDKSQLTNKVPTNNIFDKIQGLDKPFETQEQVQQRVQECNTELHNLMQEYNCAIQVMPGLFIDNEARLRVNPQVGVRYVEN